MENADEVTHIYAEVDCKWTKRIGNQRDRKRPRRRPFWGEKNLLKEILRDMNNQGK